MTLRWLSLPLLLGALLLTAVGAVSAQEEAALAVDPREQVVATASAPFEVRVTVASVTAQAGLGGYTLVMQYDPSVIRALEVRDSGFLGSTGNAAICPASAIDNDAGRVGLFCFTIPLLSEPGPRSDRPVALALVDFEPVAPGTSTIAIDETTVTDPRGTLLGATTTGGHVTVRAGQGAPMPTPGGGTPPTGPESDDGGPEPPGRSQPDEGGPAAGTPATAGGLPVSGAGPDESRGYLRSLALGLGLLGGLALLGAAGIQAAGVRLQKNRKFGRCRC